MDYFRIAGGRRLHGSIAPMGNKNSALPLLAASLLTDRPLAIGNVPDIGDVRTQLAVLRSIGVDAQLHNDVCTLNAADVRATAPDADLSSRIRTSVLLAGPLLARFGEAQIFRPGGDRIGRRRLDTHLLALQAMGAEVSAERDRYVLRAKRLRGGDLFLDEMSVTGTEQAIFAAVLARGTTTISNAAMEPHVQDVCRCLNAMGARIEGIGTHDLAIEGVDRLHGARYRIGPDYMEVGSLIALAAATGSGIRIVGAHPHEHRMTRIMYGRLGIAWQDDGDDIVVPAQQQLAVMPDFDGAVPKIDDMPWPGFPPDLISIALVVATQSRGTVLIHQKMFDPAPGVRGPADRHGRRHRAVRPAPSAGNGADPAAPGAAGLAGHPRRYGAGDRRAVRRRREHHPQHRPDRPWLRALGRALAGNRRRHRASCRVGARPPCGNSTTATQSIDS